MLAVRVLCAVMLLLGTEGQREEDEWLDPTDMLNYDATTKTMRKSETINYDEVPTKRREYTSGSGDEAASCPDVAECQRRVSLLEKQVVELKRKLTVAPQKPRCSPVFKRYLTRLLRELQALGLPGEGSRSVSVHYDAEVRLSRQDVSELRLLIEDDDGWRTGLLDDALSRILVNFKQHDYEAWRWRFEDTFGVELDTVLRVGACVLIILLVICTEVWSTVSWFVQFRRLLAICFFVSIVWNWFYLYKIAFAEHQNNVVKMERVNDKCTGVKEIDWKDNLKEWFRSTWTLQDDPCKKYYEVLMVNPILLVPPTKAISVTITTFITEPLKHFGQGIGEFLRALLKDLPVTLQIPVLLTIVFSILLFVYGSAQAVIQHAVPRALRWGEQDRQPPPIERTPVPQLREQAREAIQDAPQTPPVARPQQNRSTDGNQLRRRHHRNEVETVGRCNRCFSDDEPDARQDEGSQSPEAGVTPQSDLEDQAAEATEKEQKRKNSTPPPGAEKVTAGSAGKKAVESVGRPTQETSPEH